MKDKTASSVLITLVCLLLTAFIGHDRANADNTRTLYDNFDQMRALEALSQNQQSGTDIFTGDRSINANLRMLSTLPFLEEDNVLLFKNSARIAQQIDALLQSLEQGENNEASQVIRFNIAYEYFLFYLSFLNENYRLQFEKDENNLREVDINQLISQQELSLYLLQAQLYLQGLASTAEQPSGHKDASPNDRWIGHSGSPNFTVRNNPSLSINVDFLALMIECEKLAGRFRLPPPDDGAADVFNAGKPDEALILHYDQSSWNWLNELWKRYRFQADARSGGNNSGTTYTQTSTYCPSAETLFSLYKIYLSYNFMWRFLTNEQSNAPYLNSTTRVLLQRLSDLSKDAKQPSAFNGSYLYYQIESARDAGQTDFLPALFFARRGYFMAHLIKKEILPKDLFALYESFFSEAADRIHSNIAYRGRFYNELVLFGVALKDLQLMETKLHEYAMRSMRLEPQNNYTGKELARSARLTTVFLIANILEAKDRSGLYQGCDQYREMGDALSPLLLSSNNDNWQYGAAIHLSLARYFSQEEFFNESLAMYHARQAFLVPCEKVATTYGDKWQYFFKMPGESQAITCLKKFLYFHNKYSTNPEAAIPQKFNAPRIVNAWIAAQRK